MYLRDLKITFVLNGQRKKAEKNMSQVDWIRWALILFRNNVYDFNGR